MPLIDLGINTMADSTKPKLSVLEQDASLIKAKITILENTLLQHS